MSRWWLGDSMRSGMSPVSENSLVWRTRKGPHPRNIGIRRIVALMPVAVFALLLAAPAVVLGEEPSASLQLELKPPRTRPLGLSSPRPEIVQADTARAISEIKARERLDEVIRETIQGPRRRPDLNYDVFSGIQSRNLSNALRRR